MDKIYVLYNHGSNKYITLDDASGGYPVDVDHWWQSHFFKSREEAHKYRVIMQTGWSIYEVTAKMKMA